MRFDELADVIREHGPSLAVEVTTAFLEHHPDWRVRYGSRAMSAGVQDAGYHVAFLAAAVEADDPAAYADYARWTARVLAARGIDRRFLTENLVQLQRALTGRLEVHHGNVVGRHFQAALDALAVEPASLIEPVLELTAQVFLQAITTGQRHAAVQIAKEALRSGLSLRGLYIDVFQPALYEVGRRWESNRLTVAQEHIATAITQYVMAQVYEAPDVRTSAAKGRIVLTGVEGELHSVGAVMVGDLLETSGFQVRFLGTNLPAASILGVIRDVTPSHVAISATMLFNVGAVRQLIHAVRAEFTDRVPVVVGGAAFRANADLWRQVYADGYAADLRGIDAAFARKH
jgi:MerR family transcriptional regulator, light-induced transcriptional regulator